MTAEPIPGYTGHVAMLVPDALYVAERPGGGGRSHRAARMETDLTAAAAAGVRTIVSAMRYRHALIKYSQAGFGTRWHPLRDIVQARAELPRLADDVADVMAREPGAVLVHVDRVSEWGTAIIAVLLVRLGLADDTTQALALAGDYGFPVGDMARDLLA